MLCDYSGPSQVTLISENLNRKKTIFFYQILFSLHLQLQQEEAPTENSEQLELYTTNELDRKTKQKFDTKKSTKVLQTVKTQNKETDKEKKLTK